MNKFYSSFLFAVLLVLCAADVRAETFILRKVELQPKPVLTRNRVTYTVDLIFYRSPDEFWAYYDTTIDRIVVDMYDSRIDGPEEPVKKNTLFDSLYVKNLSSSMSLSGERAQVQIPLDREWHIEAMKFDEKVLRLSIWKDLKANLIDKKKKKSSGAMIQVLSTAFVISAVTFIVIVITTRMLRD